MIVAAIRYVADALVNATTGVNAQIPQLPRDGTDTAPALVTVYDATRFEWVARGVIPRDVTGASPLLLVRGPDEADLPTWGGDESGAWADVGVLVAFVRRPGTAQPSDYALSHAYETLRAAVRALQAQFQTMQVGPTRMGVALERPRIRFVAAQDNLAGDELILASLEVTMSAQDFWALGATVTS